MLDRRRLVTTLLCGGAALAGNLASVAAPASSPLQLHFGGIAALVCAGLCGPFWGAASALVGAAPFYRTPALVAAETLAAVLVGAAVRRGQFILPYGVLFWSTAGLIAAAMQFGGGQWTTQAFNWLASGALASLAADALLALPWVGPRLGDPNISRDFGSHLASALTFAGVAPLVALGLVGGPGVQATVLPVAVAATIAAVAGARVLGRRVSLPMLAVAEAASAGRQGAGTDNPYVAIGEIAHLRDRVSAERVEMLGKIDALVHRIAERERAYGQLLKLSERLEQRLELRGVELEQRNYSLEQSEQHYREAVELSTDIVYTLDLDGRFLQINPAGERFFGQSASQLVGRSFRRTLAPGYEQGAEEEDGARSLLDQLYASGRLTTTSVHVAAGGEIRLLQSKVELARDEEGLPFNIHGVARDVTELEGFQRQIAELGRRLQSLQKVAHRRDRELNALLSAARVINSELEIDQLLQHVIESAAAQIQAESGFVGLLDDGALTLRWYWRSSGAAWIDDHGPGVEHGVTQVVIRTRETYFCADAAADPNTDKEFTRRFGVRSMLVLPIFSQSSELLGAMALHNFPVPGAQSGPAGESEHGIDPSDMRFLEGLADLAAAAIQHARLLEQVKHQAETDALTGIFNRRAFDARFDAEILRATRFNRSLALLLIDIDFLKKINDTYGHQIGDAAICTVADVLQSRLRRHDFAARLGGEEFAALIVEARPEQALSVGRNLCDAIRKRDVPRAGHITVSIGVATFPDNAANQTDLIRIADEALYAAKKGGRDRVVLSEAREPAEPPA